MTQPNRWTHLVRVSERKKAAVPYNRSFNNPTMYPNMTKEKVVKELKDYTEEELAEITQRLTNDARHDRRKEAKRKLSKA